MRLAATFFPFSCKHNQQKNLMSGWPTRALAVLLAAFAMTLALSLGTMPVAAQAVSTGTVAGQVTDQTNAVVPGATVALTDRATQISRTATTSSSAASLST